MEGITTVLLDYDGTIHDWDSVMEKGLNDFLGLTGKEFYKTWIFDIHRTIIHTHY